MTEWRPVVGWEDEFMISDDGSLARIKGDGSLRLRVSGINPVSGYRQNVLTGRGRKPTTRYPHRLVLESFVGPCPDGCEARHLDGNRLNNRVENLAWGTHRENMDDMDRHGTRQRGSSHPGAKLTASDVRVMRLMRDAAGFSYKTLANCFGVTTMAAYLAIKGLTWADLGA